MITVTMHGKRRIHERCGVGSKAANRLAGIAFDKGINPSETVGQLNGYLNSLYLYNGQANNIRLYGDKIYIFCNDVLVTVFDTPRKYRNIVNKLIRGRCSCEVTKQR